VRSDDAAFRDLYAETASKLRAYLVRTGGDAGLADDVLQETYYRYLRTPSPDRDLPQVRGFLYRVATNLLYDHFRRRRREQKWLRGWSVGPPEPADAGLGHDLARVFGELKPRERGLLWLAYVEGWSHAEIAEILGLGAGSVRVLLLRARRRLARRLVQEGLATEVMR
jgi:RNA polymerase sigma-70 factor (ECF subfamily)